MIYIVVKDEGVYAEREVYNEAVFDSKEKAIRHVEKQGYVYNDEYEEWEHPSKSGLSDRCRIEEWEINTINERN